VSTKIFIGAVLWALVLNAQGLDQRITVTGEVQPGGTSPLGGFYVELYDSQDHTLAERVTTGADGRFQFHNVTAGWYTIRVLPAPEADPLVEEYKQFTAGSGPVVLRVPARSDDKAPSGTISLRELQHPINRKALRCLEEAQRYAHKGESQKAAAKLEEAVRIDPEFRDAHTNLGAEYARAGRIEEAQRHFLRALEIGPPDVVIYSNLSWASLAMRQFSQAEDFGRKAIALDGANSKAHLVLGNVLAMERGKEAEAVKQLQIAAPDEPKALIMIDRLRSRR
jgi:tetratricopeptide (TPR) repeat protein